MNLYEAIRKRQSVRLYEEKEIPENLLAAIRLFGQRLSLTESQIKTEIKIVSRKNTDPKLKGMWKVHAPYYLIFYSEKAYGYERNAGYVLEQISLYMTSRGLGSCFLGGCHAAELSVEGMEQIMVMAFGYAEGELYRGQELAKRLSLTDICLFPEGKEASAEVKWIINAARLAPSSLNSQPWRMVVKKDKIYLFARGDKIPFPGSARLREINMGIVLAHIVLAAEEQWIATEIITEKKLEEKKYKGGSYICTVKLG